MRSSIAAETQVQESKAGRIIEKLRRYHHQGAQPRNSESNVPLSEWMIRWGVSLATVCKIRAFAKRYSQRELEKLCSLRRRDNGLPFHWGYVCCFLAVTNKQKRSALQQRAAEENWSVAELQAALKGNDRTIEGVGRRLKMPANRLRAMRRISLDLHGLDRRFEQLLSLKEKQRRSGRYKSELRRELNMIQKKVRAVTAKLRELRALVSASAE